jgi:hypothetical protein
MSEPELPDDRELEDFLAGRSAVSRAYRADAEQQAAPAALDAPVLARAEAPVAQARRLQRWRLPMTLAASVVVAVGVLRLAVNEPAVRAPSMADAAMPAHPERARGDLAATPEPASAEAKAAPTAPAPASAEVAEDAPATLAPPPPESPFAARAGESRVAPEALLDKKRSATAAAAEARANVAIAAAPESEPSAAAPATLAKVTDGFSAANSPAPAPKLRSAFAKSTEQSAPPASVQLQGNSADAAKSASAPSLASARGVIVSTAAAVAAAPAVIPAPNAPGRYGPFVLGAATLAAVAEHYQSEVGIEPVVGLSAGADGRARYRVLEYASGADPRGAAWFYFDAEREALVSVAVSLRPALATAAIEAQEMLAAPMQIQADAPAGCNAPDRPVANITGRYPQYRVYSQRGVYLLLTAPDVVSEIGYFPPCG